MEATVQNSGLCVFKSQRYGKINLPEALVKERGKENIQKVIVYVDSYNVHVRNWPAYISSALTNKWDLSIPEGEDISVENSHVPNAEETREYIDSLKIDRKPSREDHEKVRGIVDEFLMSQGTNREEVEQREKAREITRTKHLRPGKGVGIPLSMREK